MMRWLPVVVLLAGCAAPALPAEEALEHGADVHVREARAWADEQGFDEVTRASVLGRSVRSGNWTSWDFDVREAPAFLNLSVSGTPGDAVLVLLRGDEVVARATGGLSYEVRESGHYEYDFEALVGRWRVDWSVAT